MILVSALCPLTVITEGNVVSPCGPRTFCDTSDGTAELQKCPDKALAEKLGVSKCDRCLDECPLHITLIYYDHLLPTGRIRINDRQIDGIADLLSTCFEKRLDHKYLLTSIV